MVVPEGKFREGGLWLPEEALSFPGEVGGATTPTSDPWLRFPTAGRERREPVSVEGSWRDLLETRDAIFCPKGLGENNGGTIEGVRCMPLFRFFAQTLASLLKLTTLARSIVVRGGGEGGGMLERG